ncbi:hypothetical protein SAMN05216386_0373 [Nitrosospira briensis]|uniref:Uncharacterized protein n=1 Tax=Nitrosospira briensis TaxID=35799 RepID=A0A1I4XXD3_9PROT|nr:hypothetical protein SAMN05216386_0373 [Nitrosospira briensis]
MFTIGDARHGLTLHQNQKAVCAVTDRRRGRKGGTKVLEEVTKPREWRGLLHERHRESITSIQSVFLL